MTVAGSVCPSKHLLSDALRKKRDNPNVSKIQKTTCS